MAWNYRVIRTTSEDGKNILYRVSEVYYNAEGEPTSWIEESVAHFEARDSVESLQWVLNAIQKALQKPVLRIEDDRLVEDN